MLPRVLFVSKPIVPPLHDGSKCLVRDLARGLRRHRPIVMAAPGVTEVDGPPPPGSPGIDVVPVYASGGRYAPGLLANARALVWLVGRSRADLWHFVFAPNPRTSAVGRVARALRRVPVVQTVASPPRIFAPELFFGDVVVAQSRWTEQKILEGFSGAGRPPPRLEVIAPPLGVITPRTEAEIDKLRRSLGLDPGATVFVYPGDLEVSHGAEIVARAVPLIAGALPSAVVVFACRPKTAAAPRIERALRGRLDPRAVRFAGETDLLALFGLGTAVLFPVDDLYGKVDLPISLLEAMWLGVPVVALDEGPLADLEGAVRVTASAEALAAAAIRLACDSSWRRGVVESARSAVLCRHDPAVIAARYEGLYDTLLGAGAGAGDPGASRHPGHRQEKAGR